MEIIINLVKLIAYFIIYSFLGWVMESVLKTIMLKKPVNSGFLYGPFCPIYGLGAIIMFLFLDRFKNNIFLLFLMRIYCIITLGIYSRVAIRKDISYKILGL